jgi:hypothetical protein
MNSLTHQHFSGVLGLGAGNLIPPGALAVQVGIKLGGTDGFHIITMGLLSGGLKADLSVEPGLQTLEALFQVFLPQADRHVTARALV